MSARTGFTLIELLVVIGILSLLAAVLFPVYFSVRENGRQTTCMTNMKQLAMLFMQDQDQHEDAYIDHARPFTYPWDQNPYPPEEQGTPGYLGFQPNGNILEIMDKITVCPSDTEFNITRHRFSYMMNGFLVRGSTVRGRIGNPASTIYLVEASHNPVVSYVEPWRIYDPGTHALNTTELTKLKSEIAVERHHGGSNYAFMDGHVKWMHFEQTVHPISLYDIRNE